MEIANNDLSSRDSRTRISSDCPQQPPDDRQYGKAKIVDIGSGHSGCRRSKRPEELIVELEAQNAALRNQSQQLMLQIQALKDSRSR